MDDYRLPKKNLNYKPEGRRNIGRPQTRWEDDFREEGTGRIDEDDDLENSGDIKSFFPYLIADINFNIKCVE